MTPTTVDSSTRINRCQPRKRRRRRPSPLPDMVIHHPASTNTIQDHQEAIENLSTISFGCSRQDVDNNCEETSSNRLATTITPAIRSRKGRPTAQYDLSKKQKLPNKMRPIFQLICTLAAILIGQSVLIGCLQMQMQPSDATLPAEARGELPINSYPYDKIVNLLAGLANQQQQQQGQQRRIPLNNQNLQPNQPQRNQMLQPALQQASTPVNPFLVNNGAQQFQQQQQQQRRVNQFQQPPSLFVSSSPPTNYLTLNRINNQARPFNQPVQPVNTIPLGSMTNQNGMNQRPMVPVRSVPSRVNQPSSQQFGLPINNIVGGQQRVQASGTVPSMVRGPVKPLSGGFAPSGPPPSAVASSNNNNATIVLQPPTSSTGSSEPSNKSEVQVSPSPNSVSADLDDKMAQPTTISVSASETVSTTSNAPPVSQPAESKTTGGPKTVESDWNPVDSNRNSTIGELPLQSIGNRTGVTLSPSPDIVTVPPGYNPDNPSVAPQNYDISVSANMGGSASSSIVVVQQADPVNSTDMAPTTADTVAPSKTQQQQQPTAITTIIWSPSASGEESSSTSMVSQVQPSQSQKAPSSTALAEPRPPVNRIRDSSMLNDEPKEETVYGKAASKEAKPAAPNPTAVLSQASVESSVAGRPHVQPVQLDNQVRPFAGDRSLITKSNHGQTHSGPPALRSSRPMNGSPLQVGGGFSIAANGNQTMPTGDIQDYVAGQPPFLVPAAGSDSAEPSISGQGGPDPASFELSQNSSVPEPSSSVAPPTNRVRRPTFKPKLADPPIRIDSCIVGDDSSCEQTHNERCVTEYGISSCHCKPGFARLSQLRGFCQPVSQIQLSFKIDKLSDERRLVLNQTLTNPNTEEYQYLEFETIQALAGAFLTSNLAKQFMGARVNGFFERKRSSDHKVWANVTLSFELNNVTRSERFLSLASQELQRAVASKRPLGDSTLVVDGAKESVSALADVNECANRELNDCHKFATCHNDFGGFRCQCLPGYEDKHSQSEEPSRRGRTCLGCPASYCSNRGECSINDGQRQCKCRANFVGARCDIDSEVLAVAIGGSLVGIIIMIITFWCLFVFNRRWKREQQKMDAMSATSGLTYNYVNSNSTNSLMSPSLVQARQPSNPAGLHRSGGHPVSALAANYGQRFGVALVGGARHGLHHQHYAADQQAIIGSTSSGSSAASQPICGGYAPANAYQYEDAGLLIAPASSGSSEQTSPSGNSYGGHQSASAALMAGNSYTLSGHAHHAHHHHHHRAHHRQPKLSHLSQFHPAADYRTLNASQQQHCQPAYDSRWRTLQQDAPNKQSALMGYYLSPDMLAANGQHVHQMHQMYASPQQELCIDTGNKSMAAGRQLHQSGRAVTGANHTLRSRVHPNNGAYHQDRTAHLYDHERPI